MSEPNGTETRGHGDAEKAQTFESLHAIARRLNVAYERVVEAVEGKVMLVKFLIGGNGLPLVRSIDVERLLGK